MTTFEKFIGTQDGRTLFSNRQLLLLVAAFFAWRGLRGIKGLFWTVFGLANAVFWTGAYRFW